MKAAPDGGATVVGNGSPSRPYLIGVAGGNPLLNLDVVDSPTLDLTISGAGTVIDKRKITGQATQSLVNLKDVRAGQPLTEGDVPVWRTDHWEFEAQTGGGGGAGLPPGGTDGQVLTKQSATDGDADWENPGGSVADPLDYCVLRNTVAQTLTSSVETPITFGASPTSTDPLGMWDGSSTVTVKRSGLYEIVANFSYASTAAAGSRINLIKINGGTNKQWYELVIGGQSNFATHAYTIQLNAGDTIQMRQYQSSGANLDTFAGTATLPSLHVTRLPEGLPGGGGVVVERPMVARRKHAAATSILHNTLTTIPFDTEDYTDGLFWDSANSAFTAPVDGYYDVEAVLSFAANAAGGRITYVYVDGVSQGASSTESTGGAVTRIATTVKALAGQKITVRALQTSGVSLALNGNSGYNFVSVTKVPQSFAGSAVSTYGERNYVALRRHITNTSLTTGINTVIPLDTPDYADGITWSTDGFIVPVTGYYSVDGMVSYLQNATGARYAYITVDGAPVCSSTQPINIASTTSVSISATIFATAGQKIGLGAMQNSGANLSLYGNTFYTWMSIAKIPAPVINGAAASGVWGSAPLDAATYGSNSLAGREVYIDANGQLRTKPEQVSGAIAQFPVTALPTVYPSGTSVMYVSAADGAAWPTAGAAVVTTIKTSTSEAIQWCASPGNVLKLWVRNGSSAAWSPWQPVGGAGLGKRTAAGRVSVSISAAVSGTAVVTFPAGLFTTAPRVTLCPIGSSVWLASTTGQPTASGFTAVLRQVDGTTSTATIAVDWIAIEE